MDDENVVAAILTAPIISKLAGSGGDIPPEVAVSVYEEVLIALRKVHKNDPK